jgi:uncharacterized FAD-dependent dehydrogenase
MDFQVIIVGAGPAGIFAALTLADLGIDSVLLLEKGKDLEQRNRLKPEDMLCGWGGAGAFSDGKLMLSPELGGFLGEFLDRETLSQLLRKADEVFVAHGAPNRVFGETSQKVEALGDRARLAGLELVPTRIRHIGTENCAPVLGRLRQTLRGRVEARTGCQVQSLVAENGRIRGVRLADDKVITSRFVVVAPGRSGASWMKEQAESLGLNTKPSPVDIGVRVELPASILKEITDAMHESKLIYYSKTFHDKVRTFCMNPYGHVVIEKNGEISTVNGHSYAEKIGENTNFAILVSSRFTEPFDDPIAYVMSASTSITQKCHDIDNPKGRLCQHIDNPYKGFCSIMSPSTHLPKEAVKWNKDSESKQSQDIYREKLPKPYTVISNGRNIGFSSGSNAIKPASRTGLRISPGLP